MILSKLHTCGSFLSQFKNSSISNRADDFQFSIRKSTGQTKVSATCKLLILSCGRWCVFHTIFIISQAHYRKIASHYSFPVDGTWEWFQRKQTVGKWQLFSNKWLIATPHIAHNNLHISTGMSLKYFSLTGDTKTCQINCFVGSFIIAVSPTAFVPIIKYCFPFRL